MHDFDEGVYKYGMSHILHHYIYNIKNITLNTLNDRLKGFDYTSNNISNRLPALREHEVKKKHLSFSANEMSNFLLLFPFLVGEDVSYDEVWEYYLILRKIHDLVNAKYLQKECAGLLGVLVEEHHVKYCNVFMDNLKPKHHNMTHYKTILKKSGPPSHLSVARFESKNRLLKLAANATCSRKNITHSLAVKEQLYLCYRFSSKIGLIDNQKLGSILFADDISYFNNYSTFKNSLPANFIGKCLELSWAQFKGICYKPNLCVVVNISFDHLPQFGIVRHVLCNDSNLCLVYQNLLNKRFCKNLHGWEVEVLSEMSCILVEHLCHPFPAIIARLPKSGSLLVSTKYAL
ncbi:PREDICTED: uncharacterized protein LOC105558828 [Vollenhovia emeryi]|uniref:uncharacterized protein LOC105558828 n=1 Tax=Vollenhovia emeryi TaxID=411798 RepID=UPI0005F4D4F4|nr:PREDICTED: uncharacterized protein LOC105558828 [Vollenhovia emeryi]